MDVDGELKKGLQADPKYIPVWYRYDKQGSVYNDQCLTDNTYYYFYQSEVQNIKEHIQAIVNEVKSPCVLVEMGSGNSEKSRMFIDTLLEKQDTLTYIPVDISAEFLKATADALSRDYGECLKVNPVAGDYSVGIQELGDVEGRKLILWLGGGFQNQPYDVQVERIRCLSQTMSSDDRLLIALDVTQDATVVQNAYLDPTGISAPLYLNPLWRLNREHNADIDADSFRLEAKFERRTEDDELSRVVIRAYSKIQQTIHIPGLDLTLTLKEGEPIYMHEGEGVSCKYTEAQIRTLTEKGQQKLHKIWIDNNKHVALCCIGK